MSTTHDHEDLTDQAGLFNVGDLTAPNEDPQAEATSGDSQPSVAETEPSANVGQLDEEVDDSSQVSSKNHRGRNILIGATAALAAAGTVISVVSASGKSNKSTPPVAESTPNPTPTATPSTPTPTSTPSATSIPIVAPTNTPEVTASPSTSTGLTAEQLLNMAPIPVPFDPQHPNGSEAAVQAIYQNLQLADITGRVDFLSAALGATNLQSDIGNLYQQDMTQYQTFFENNPDQRLIYKYEATNIHQADPTSTTYNLIAVQTIGGRTTKSAQTIELAIQYDNKGNRQGWILRSVDQAVPIN